MNRLVARAIIKTWPLPFGEVRLLRWLNPSPPNVESVTTRLRGYRSLLSYDPRSYIGRYIYFRGIFEQQIVSRIASFVRKGMTVIDIGANIGQHTCVTAELVGPTGCVLSIEPQAAVRRRLVENVALNAFSNVAVVSHAVGNISGSGRLYHTFASNDGAATLGFIAGAFSEEVSVRTLCQVADEVGVERADIVKIDVEGAEYQVLCGSERFLDRNPPTAIFVECIDKHLNRFGHRTSDVIRWLHDRQYHVEALERGQWREVRRGTAIDADLVAYKL